MSTYQWTGGKSGFTGTITLDSDTSPAGGGSVKNIVSMTIGIPAPGGQFKYPPGLVSNPAAVLTGTLSWDAKSITAMAIRWAPNGPTAENINLGPTKLSDYNPGKWSDPTVPNPLEDQTGSWRVI